MPEVDYFEIKNRELTPLHQRGFFYVLVFFHFRSYFCPKYKNMMDALAREKVVAKKAAAMLRSDILKQYPSFRNRITVSNQARKVDDMLGKITPRFRQGYLDRLVVYATKYSFHSHYGYNLGSKSEWEARRSKRQNIQDAPENRDVPGTLHFTKSINNSSALEYLATEVSKIRLIQVGNEIIKL